MATAILDLDINEGETFIMSVDFWDNVDRTIPSDLTDSEFVGSMKIGQRNIPMVIVKTFNVIEATIDYQTMKDLSKKGKYDIDELINGESFRIFQGDLRISKEVTV